MEKTRVEKYNKVRNQSNTAFRAISRELSLRYQNGEITQVEWSRAELYLSEARKATANACTPILGEKPTINARINDPVRI